MEYKNKLLFSNPSNNILHGWAPPSDPVVVIGACGQGMGPLSILLKEAGCTLECYDIDPKPPMSITLKQEADIDVKIGFPPQEVMDNASIIVGAGTQKNTMDSVSVEKSFAEILGTVMCASPYKRMVVAGSAGKSTCTSLCAHLLAPIGAGWLIGAPSTGQRVQARWGDPFVVEGCEYPSSMRSGRLESKFIHYRPHTLLLTSTAWDHINVFKTPEDYVKRFDQLLSGMKKGSLVVACSDHVDEQLLTKHESRLRIVRYSPTNTQSDWYINEDSKTNKEKIPISIKAFGEHNRSNALGVVAWLCESGYRDQVDFDSISTFVPPDGRLEILCGTDNDDVVLIRDFCGSWAKIDAGIQALSERFPERSITILMHRFTMMMRSTNTTMYDYDYDKKLLSMKWFSKMKHRIRIVECDDYIKNNNILELDPVSVLLVVTYYNLKGCIEDLVDLVNKHNRKKHSESIIINNNTKI